MAISEYEQVHLGMIGVCQKAPKDANQRLKAGQAQTRRSTNRRSADRVGRIER